MTILISVNIDVRTKKITRNRAINDNNDKRGIMINGLLVHQEDSNPKCVFTK